MGQHDWMKYVAVAMGAVGFIVIIGLAVNIGEGLEGRVWVVDKMSIDGTMTAPVPGATPLANFNDGGIGGTAGCNVYNGAYEAEDGSMSIGHLVTTMMYCEEPAGTMEQEFAYLELLELVDSFVVDGDQLTLSGGDTVLILYSEKVVEEGLNRTVG